MVQRSILALVSILPLLAACGGGGGDDTSQFRFDISDYPGIVVLPLAAYQERRPTNATDDRSPESGIIQTLRDAADTPTDTPFLTDWDTMLGLASNGMGDDRDVQRYYLAYEVTSTPSQNGCTVVVHVFEGLPFNPNRPALTSFTETVSFGEQHRDGFEITTPNECEDEAGHRVAEQMAAANFLAEGWSVGPPAHAGG